MKAIYKGQKTALGPLKLELLTIVNYQAGAGNHVHALFKDKWATGVNYKYLLGIY